MTSTEIATVARFTVVSHATGSDLTIEDQEHEVIDGRDGSLVTTTSKLENAQRRARSLNARLSL
jgi:hypothetical protein